MYEDQTYETILQRMLDRVSDKFDKREGSVIYDSHSPAAIEFQILYLELETMISNSYGDTASREFLILLCKDRGIIPTAATCAVLQGKFTPDTIDVTGKRFNISSLNYVVTEKISAGYYKVECETAGIIGNQYFGTMIPIEYIDGLETAELTELLIPGEDEEDTEALRERYFASFDEFQYGGNVADYLEKVRSINGVGDVKVTRVWNGDISPAALIPNDPVKSWFASYILTDGLNENVKEWLTAVFNAAAEKKLTVGGTVLVTVIDSDDYGEASQSLIDSIQTALDPTENAGEGYGVAPIGHVVNVKSASPVSIYVTATFTFKEGYSWDSTKQELEDAVSAYLLELRKDWVNGTYTIVRISQIESRLLAVSGIVDIADTKLNGETGNITLTEYQIPVLGGVST